MISNPTQVNTTEFFVFMANGELAESRCGLYMASAKILFTFKIVFLMAIRDLPYLYLFEIILIKIIIIKLQTYIILYLASSKLSAT